MKIVDLSQIAKTKVTMEGAEGVLKQLPISKRDGSPAYTFRVFTIQPGRNTPYHAHNFEHINYVIEGEATIVDERGEERVIKRGNFVLILPNEKHQYKNKSRKNVFIMICAVPNEYD